MGAAHQGNGGIDRGVGRTTRQHHLGATFQSGLKRLDPHHGDDPLALVDFIVGEFCDGTKGFDLAIGEFGLQIFGGLFGMD